MINDFRTTLEMAYNIAENKTIPYKERKETIRQYIKKAESIYRKIYKDLSYWERKEARTPINDLKRYFNI